MKADLAIVGAGLAGGVLALALRQRLPALNICLIDSGDRVGGNHLWSFFGSDIAAAHRWIVAPLLSHSWAAHDVRFPRRKRTLNAPYYSIESRKLDQLVRRALPPPALMLGRRVIGTSPTVVVLADGDRVEARGVIDARGAGDLSKLDLGWQKFVGHEFALEQPHALARPIIMDATIDQLDGYRFFYVLPFSPTRLFIEDTYYSDTPNFGPAAPGQGGAIDPVAQRINAYAEANGWQTGQVMREERGVLPVALGGDFAGYWQSSGNKLAKIGMRAGLFHPTTGYSLPDAVRTAALIAGATDLSGAALHDLLYGFAQTAWRKRGFYRLLDTMLYKASEPAERYRILEHFYRLNPALIGRFYAGTTTMFDRARILSGKPPVKISAALSAIKGMRR